MQHKWTDEKKLARRQWKEEKRGYAAVDKTWNDLLAEMGSVPGSYPLDEDYNEND